MAVPECPTKVRSSRPAVLGNAAGGLDGTTGLRDGGVAAVSGGSWAGGIGRLSTGPGRSVGAGGGLWITPAETGQQKAKTSTAALSVLRIIFSSLTVELVGRSERPPCAG